MALYPLFAELRGRTVLVVGGGAVAARKVAGLLEAEARVCLVAPALSPILREQRDAGRIEHVGTIFAASQLVDAWLVIAATDDTALNLAVAAAASLRHVLVNVVDDAQRSTFHCPARLRRGPLVVAISSGGKAPVLARRLRAQLEIDLGPAWAGVAALAARYRRQIRTHFRLPTQRRRFYDWLIDGPVFSALCNGRAGTAEQTLTAGLNRGAGATLPAAHGEVSLVGAGPGDPGLLTLAAMRALQSADVILHDRLVGQGILELARRDAECIDVGKRVGQDPAATQARIHQLLLEHAMRGKHVVRLHGGDALVFGRSGEELALLRAHGILCTVIPGITAASAAAAAAGVPLTDRRCAAALVLATAHRTHAWTDADWTALARGNQTLALYMAVAQIDTLARELMGHGMSRETPFVLVERASQPDQRRLSGLLRDLPALARRSQIQSPALLIVGQVAAPAMQRTSTAPEPAPCREPAERMSHRALDYVRRHGVG